MTVVLAAWGFALWYSVTRTGPEPLDSAVASALRNECGQAARALRELDPVDAADPASARAGLIERENGILRAMVEASGALETSQTDGQIALDAWLADWEDLLAARGEFATQLRGTSPKRLVVPSDDRGRPITLRMDEYARYHDASVCSPLDLRAEVVEGRRNYAPL